MTGALLAGLVIACTPSTTSVRADLERTVAQDAATLGPPAAALPGITVAISMPEAPGYNVEDLSARVRVAVQRGSGLVAVDAMSVQAELGACTVAPCPDALAIQYRDARYICASSLSRIGDVFIVSVRVQRGIQEVARANAEDKDARIAVMRAAYAAGQALRASALADASVMSNDDSSLAAAVPSHEKAPQEQTRQEPPQPQADPVRTPATSPQGSP